MFSSNLYIQWLYYKMFCCWQVNDCSFAHWQSFLVIDSVSLIAGRVSLWQILLVKTISVWCINKAAFLAGSWSRELQRTRKISTKCHRQYAKRWRDLIVRKLATLSQLSPTTCSVCWIINSRYLPLLWWYWQWCALLMILILLTRCCRPVNNFG